MKGKIVLILTLLFLLFPSFPLFAYTDSSLRIKALGEGLAGIMEDEYTDIYRNPAFLAFVDHPQLIVDFGRCKPKIASVCIPYIGYLPIVYPETPILVQADSIRYHLPKPASSYPPSPKTTVYWGDEKTDDFVLSDRNPRGPRFLLGLVANPFPFLFQSGMGAVVLNADYYKNTDEIDDIVHYYDYQGKITLDREYHDMRGTYQKNTDVKLIYSFSPSLNSQMGLDFTYSLSQNEDNGTHYSLESDGSGSVYKRENKSKNLDQFHLYLGRLGFTQLLSPNSQLDLVWKAFSSSDKNRKSLEYRSHRLYSYSSTEVTTREAKGSYPGDIWGLGLEANLKKELSSSKNIHYILGFAYRNEDWDGPEEENYHYSYTFDDSIPYSRENERTTDLTHHSSGELYRASFGLGLELRPRDNLKIGIGLRGDAYKSCEKENLTGRALYTYFNTLDSLFTENAYDLSERVEIKTKGGSFLVPMGMEIMASRSLCIRFGVSPYAAYCKAEEEKKVNSRLIKTTDEDGHTSVNYTFGLGYNIGQRASFDLYTQGDFTSVNNWQGAATVGF